MVDLDGLFDALSGIEPDYGYVRAAGPDAVPPLAEIAAKEDQTSAPRAVYALGALAETLQGGDERFEAIARTLERAARSGEVLMRVAAASAAHALPPELATTVHRLSLADQDAGVRATALEMAPRYLTGDLVAAFEQLLGKEEDKNVAELARRILESHPRG